MLFKFDFNCRARRLGFSANAKKHYVSRRCLTMVVLGTGKQERDFGTSVFFSFEFYLICLSNSTQFLLKLDRTQ